LFRKANDAEPENARALGGAVKALVTKKELNEAEKLLAGAPEKLLENEHIKSAQAALRVVQQAGSGEDIAKLLENIKRNPNDHQSRLGLAIAYFASGNPEGAIDELLEIFRRDRAWNEEAARKQLVGFFDALGHGHPLTVSGRKRLSSLMFA